MWRRGERIDVNLDIGAMMMHARFIRAGVAYGTPCGGVESCRDTSARRQIEVRRGTYRAYSRLFYRPLHQWQIHFSTQLLEYVLCSRETIQIMIMMRWISRNINKNRPAENLRMRLLLFNDDAMRLLVYTRSLPLSHCGVTCQADLLLIRSTR